MGAGLLSPPCGRGPTAHRCALGAGPWVSDRTFLHLTCLRDEGNIPASRGRASNGGRVPEKPSARAWPTAPREQGNADHQREGWAREPQNPRPDKTPVSRVRPGSLGGACCLQEEETTACSPWLKPPWPFGKFRRIYAPLWQPCQPFIKAPFPWQWLSVATCPLTPR